MKPARGLLLVRPVETTETYEGSAIVVPEMARQRLTAWQCEAVAKGRDELCDDEDCERQHIPDKHGRAHCVCESVAVGDWLLVRPRSYIDTADPERKLWLVRQRDVLAVFREQA